MITNNTDANLQADVEAIGHISIIPTILEVICKTTGMRFAAVARVTTERWIACSVRDEVKFGLLPGGELKVDTTICHEIRQSGNGVIIDDVDKDEFYCTHHTPITYGLKSYISLPIARQDGSFFGTLCAIDPSPAILNTPEIVGMFKVFADLISFHLNAIEQLPLTEVKLLEERTGTELYMLLAAIMEHDLEILSRDKRSKQFAAIIKQAIIRIKELVGSLRVAV